MLFEYKAKSSPEKIETGVIEAESQSAAALALQSKNLYVLSLAPCRSLTKKKTAPRVKRGDITAFTRQLANLLRAGFTLSRALQTLVKQYRNSAFKDILENICRRINKGEPFSRILESYPGFFSPFYISIVRVGEAGGQLDRSLERLALSHERRQEINSQVRSALAYPAFLLSVGLATIFILMTLVIPELASMFTDLNQTLPLPTLIVMAVSDFMASFWWLVIILLIIFVLVGQSFYRNEQKRLIIDRFMIRIPVLRGLLQKIETANYFQALGVLLENGLPMLEALDVASSSVANRYVRHKCSLFGEEIRQGKTLSSCFVDDDFFPAITADMAAVGEESGDLSPMLISLADSYEKEVRDAVKALVSLLEPVLILVLGGIIGFLAVSMLLPIFQINLIAE